MAWYILSGVKGDGRISADDAADLFDKLAKDGKYTDLEKTTIAYKFVTLFATYNWALERGRAEEEAKADKALRFAVRVWAAERGANK